MDIHRSAMQVIGTIFVIFAWSRAFLRFLDDMLKLFAVIFWSLLWIAVLIVLFLPQTTDILATKLGIGRGDDVVIYGSLVIMYYMGYRVYVKIESLEREITH